MKNSKRKMMGSALSGRPPHGYSPPSYSQPHIMD